MSTVFQLLMEEHERLREAKQLYADRLAEFPKGTPRTKTIHGNKYLYLNRREGRKVVDQYIGRADSDRARDVLKLVEKRNQLLQLYRETVSRLREVRKVLRGKI